MKKILINMMLCLCAIGMNAQTLKQQGNAVEQIVPEGWEHEEEEGDLNKDGIKDLVVLAKPNFKENMKTGRVARYKNGKLKGWRIWGY